MHWDVHHLGRLLERNPLLAWWHSLRIGHREIPFSGLNRESDDSVSRSGRQQPPSTVLLQLARNSNFGLWSASTCRRERTLSMELPDTPTRAAILSRDLAPTSSRCGNIITSVLLAARRRIAVLCLSFLRFLFLMCSPLVAKECNLACGKMAPSNVLIVLPGSLTVSSCTAFLPISTSANLHRPREA